MMTILRVQVFPSNSLLSHYYVQEKFQFDAEKTIEGRCQRKALQYNLQVKIERKIEDAAGRIWMSVKVINC